MLKKELTVVIYTENNIGLLNRITTMFSRRRINIESLNVAASGIEGIHRLTLMVYESEDIIKKLMPQIEKQVDVFNSFYHTNEEIVWQEQILYKIAANSSANAAAEHVVKNYGGRRISVNENYTVYETTGPTETTDALVKVLELMGITEMVRGARIVISKSENNFHQKLK